MDPTGRFMTTCLNTFSVVGNPVTKQKGKHQYAP